MKKYFRFLHFGTLVLALTMLLGSFSLTNPFASAESVQETLSDPSLTNCFDITATDRNGEPLEPFNSEDDFVQYYYDKIEKVTFYVKRAFLERFDKSENPTYSINVERIQMDVAEIPTFDSDIKYPPEKYPNKLVEDVFKGNLSDIDEHTGFDYYIDPPQNKEKDHGIGWGVYRFSITVTSATYSDITTTGKSTFVAVKPATDFPAQATIELANDEQVSGGLYYLGSKFIFRLTNDFYKYCDQTLLVWYIDGEAVNGVKYVLMPEDLENPKYQGYKALQTVVNRTGNTFEFEIRYAGTWKVWCTVNPGQANEKTSNVVEVTTFQRINTNVLIGILVGCGVLLLGFIVFIIIYTKKREKVW